MVVFLLSILVEFLSFLKQIIECVTEGICSILWIPKSDLAIELNFLLVYVNKVIPDVSEILAYSGPRSFQVFRVKILLEFLEDSTLFVESTCGIQSAQLLHWPCASCVGAIHDGHGGQDLTWLDVVPIVYFWEGCHHLCHI